MRRRPGWHRTRGVTKPRTLEHAPGHRVSPPQGMAAPSHRVHRRRQHRRGAPASVAVLFGLRDESIARDLEETRAAKTRRRRGWRRPSSATARPAARGHTRLGVELLERAIRRPPLAGGAQDRDHLPEERTRFTQLWSGWMEALPAGVRHCRQNHVKSLGFSPGQPWIATETPTATW
jgi:hypothetical protein